MPRIKPLMLLPPLVFGAFVALAAFGMFREDPEALPSALAGRAAPPVKLEPLTEMPSFSDATLRDGEVKLVNFWASWCAPCRAEHPNLEALAVEGLPIYGINYKDDPAKAQAFLDELGNPYAAIGTDRSGRTALEWGLYGVPETYVVDGNGTILLRHAGPITQRIIDSTLRPALDQARSR
jgi:cytochrome c biogenesis protein CcmG/thiol:disulfide interchange protein DsbE